MWTLLPENPDLPVVPSDPADNAPPATTPGEDMPGRILLGEIPAPRTHAPVPFEPLPAAAPASQPPLEDPVPTRPSRLAPVKALVNTGYFDPAKAFAFRVDWARFRRAQLFLFLLSMAMPFLAMLLLGILLGVVYLTGASLYSVTSPNPVYQIMAYPLVFVLARGYWIAYLALPLGLFAVGWLCATLTAWVLSRMDDGAGLEFGKALSILAMLGAMIAPFTLFPFLRLVALAGVLWIIVRRLEDTFDIGFWRALGTVTPVLLGGVILYGLFERKVESYFPAGEELRGNLHAFVNQKKMLEWPSFQAKVYINPNERLYADLTNFSVQVREQAVQKAMNILKTGGETAEFRFRLATRLAENDQSEAFLYLSRYCATGQGTPADPAAALDWIQKYSNTHPENLAGILEQARLLMLNNRRLQGKRLLVAQVKHQWQDLYKVAEFIQKEGLGRVDSVLNSDVLGLYQNGNTLTQIGAYNPTYTGSRYGYESHSRQEELLRRLYSNERDQSLWFYRALVSEFLSSGPAGPEVYGEAPTPLAQADLDQRIQEGDAVAMDIAADRCLQEGNITKARQYWLAAVRGLNSDSRSPNVPFYLKLAESYDSEGSPGSLDPREATRYYLGALLISSWQGRGARVGQAPLNRLLGGKVPDPMNQPFLDLCLKYDLPEAWVMMGDRYLNGDFPGVAKNLAKGREAFLRAQALGYRGPQFQTQINLLNAAAKPAPAPTR